MLAKDALVPNPLVVTIDTSILELLEKILGSNQTTAVVVGEDQRPVGMVGAHDILARFVPNYIAMDERLADVVHDGYFEAKIHQFSHIKAGEIMVEKLDYIEENDTLLKACAILVKHQRKTLPVMSKNGKFVGLLTRRSLLNHVHKLSKP